jgi:antitoxin CptB
MGLVTTEDTDTRRKRLLYRSWHRGTREADLLLGPFAERHLAKMTPPQLDRFEDLLNENDADLYDWIGGRADPPPGRDSDVLRLLQQFRFSPRPA